MSLAKMLHFSHRLILFSRIYGEVGTQKFERFLAKENIHVSFKNDMKANAVVRQASLDMSAKFENMHNWTCQQGLRNRHQMDMSARSVN